MKIKEKITNMVNTFIADPENAEMVYRKSSSRWSIGDRNIFWRLISQNEKFTPIYYTAREFQDYLLENELLTPEWIACDFKEYYKNSGYGYDMGLSTFCEKSLTDNFSSEDIDKEDLYEKVVKAESLWYWDNILNLAAQDTIRSHNLYFEVTEYL